MWKIAIYYSLFLLDEIDLFVYPYEKTQNKSKYV